MNYTGKIVHHNIYGNGIVESEGKKGVINVRFDGETESRKFVAPDCFKRFLTLIDRDAAVSAEEENVKKEQKLKEEKDKEKQQNRAFSKVFEVDKKENSKVREIATPNYSSVEDFVSSQTNALFAEIDHLRKNGGKRIKLLDGQLIEIHEGKYIYSFESDSELNLPDGTEIILWPKKINEGIDATAITCVDFSVIIETGRYLGDNIESIEFSNEAWRLLGFLSKRLIEIKNNPSEIVQAIVCDGRKKEKFRNTILKGQENACSISCSQKITFIWGPPGTGKTETLANIALKHLEKKERVLMLSYSNVSVDGAIMRVFHKDNNRKAGKLVRYGYPRDKELLHHEFLTSYNLVLKNHPLLRSERNALYEEQRRLSRNSSRYVAVTRRLKEIKDKLDKEEENAVQDASFVATTVSKAVADKTLYEGNYDTVIFDEASMAYIPQIIFAASLAKKHFICMGDFNQLPPIVQSDRTSILNVDIFKYCGIVDAVESGRGHEWLCMLDIQYRMHPEIASFSSRTMYRNLLKSGPGMKEKREDVVQSDPIPGNSLSLIDLSGMLNYCKKTADQSRVNVLSSMISMGLAINAADTHEVGIITPYNAQSRLLHAMSRDVAERAPELKKISCATVHQFQGSEKDIIFYDAVDCYPMKYPGTLITATANKYANRLYNVAVTRAKGKMISIVNKEYMFAKGLSNNLIFRKMIEELTDNKKVISGKEAIAATANRIVESFSGVKAEETYLQDLKAAKREVQIEITGKLTGSSEWLVQFAKTISSLKKHGLKVVIRTTNKNNCSPDIRKMVIENKFLSDPVTIIDRETVWYGMPFYESSFISEGKMIPTKFYPVLRFKGKHFAVALYGLLDMNRTIDDSEGEIDEDGEKIYQTFSSYIYGEVKCIECGSRMKMRKSKDGRFFLACMDPNCSKTQSITTEMVDGYLYFNNRKGKRCPIDHTSLIARRGPHGIYVHCGCEGVRRHNYSLDKI